MYSPTTSSSFSTNFGSREILKPRTRWGFGPCARQIPAPWCRSHPLRGQGCACSTGGRRRQVWVVRRTISAASTTLLRPPRGRSCSIAAGRLARSAPASDPPAHGRSSTALQWPDSPDPAPPTAQCTPAGQPHRSWCSARQSLQRLLFIRIQFVVAATRITGLLSGLCRLRQTEDFKFY